MNCFAFLRGARRAGCLVLLGATTNVVTFGQRVPCYTVMVEVNDSRCATITVPKGQIVIIDYDTNEKTLCLSDIEPINLHPSPNYIRKGSIFFSAIRPGTYQLNWRSGSCRSRIVVR